MNELDQIPEIKMQTLVPFEKRPHCRKCGAKSPSFWRRLFRRKKAKKKFGLAYCPGGKPPSEETRHMFFSYTKENICAGMNKEHMHRNCWNCGFHWLSEVCPK